jgi:hypothetical protein
LDLLIHHLLAITIAIKLHILVCTNLSHIT